MQDNTASTVIDFLEHLRPGGPWVLTAIMPDGPIETITARHADEVRKFISTNNGGRNLYYSVNPTREAMKNKAAKTDIAQIEYLLSDLDPKDNESPEAAKARYREGLEMHRPAPTAIIDSGNGIQALWRLAEPIKLAEPVMETDATEKVTKVFPPETAAIIADAEARTASLMVRLGSVAGTQNIDRILRLPGTTNLPNKKKLKAGRVKCSTKLISFNGATCKLEDFPAVAEDTKSKKNKSSAIDINVLPISQRMKDLIRGINDREHPYESRSEAVYAAIVAMVGGGCTDDQIEEIFLDRSYPISAHVLEQKTQSSKYLARQIAKARKVAVDRHVAKLNKSYALVIVGDKTAILKLEHDSRIKFLTHSAFDLWHANRFICYQDKNGDQKKISLSKYWLHHPQRRQYEGITFTPGREIPNQYNLWHGFAVKPRQGDCSKLLAHLKDNICHGDKELFSWVVGWFAQIVQHPEKKMGTSLVVRGKQGTGKTKVGEVIGSLLGEHYALVSEPRYVTGRFNSHLVSCLLLHCDGSFWAGDHAAEGKLKDLITGDHHFIEYKGKEPIRVRNYVRLFVTGNPDWLVPAGFEERRFAVLEIGDDHIQDGEYFAAIDAEMDNGGRAALLDFLLRFDLTSVDLRTIPKTAALLDQKIASLSPEKRWWLDVLSSGELPYGGKLDDAHSCRAQHLFNAYIAHAGKTGAKWRSIETAVGMFLSKYVPGLLKMSDENGSYYVFPPLSDCRKAFANLMQQEFTWDGPSEWWKPQQNDQFKDAPF